MTDGGESEEGGVLAVIGVLLLAGGALGFLLDLLTGHGLGRSVAIHLLGLGLLMTEVLYDDLSEGGDPVGDIVGAGLVVGVYVGGVAVVVLVVSLFRATGTLVADLFVLAVGIGAITGGAAALLEFLREETGAGGTLATAGTVVMALGALLFLLDLLTGHGLGRSVAIHLFGLGLVALDVVYGDLVTGEDPRPVWAYGVASAGYVLGLVVVLLVVSLFHPTGSLVAALLGLAVLLAVSGGALALLVRAVSGGVSVLTALLGAPSAVWHWLRERPALGRSDAPPRDTPTGQSERSTSSAANGQSARARDRATSSGPAEQSTAGSTLGGLPSELSGIEAVTAAEQVGTDGSLGVYDARDRDGESARLLVVESGTTSDVSAFESVASRWLAVGSHPNVVEVREWGTDPRPWILTESVPGATLATAGQSLLLPEKLSAVVDVCEGVLAGSHYNVRHLALAPGRVRYDERAERALVDGWGISTLYETDLTPYTPPERLAPEQYGPLGEHTDVYGIGAIAYTLLAGHPPYEADEAAILAGDPVPPSEASVNVHWSLDRPVLDALAVDPDDRPDSVRDLQVALQRELRSLT